ncbi:MAG: type VI secretion system protein TssA [Alphaproteobacteria bacterium]|nr:type VI secretion system protein TssA [Alphaproteobacteria bacterium]MBO4643598.1 type VI secretion system protein TssA [Alphaproteobacteria bacterium]
MITATDLMKTIDGADSAGANPEYDQLYLDLENLAVADEDAGKEPDYRQLEKNCLELWKKTRDLRVAAYLCVAETELNGFEGFAEGLEIVRWLIGEMWNDFYPRLDPDDDNDPLERLNIMAMLSPQPGAFNDPIMFLSKLRTIRLMPELPYTMRDVMISNGELESEKPVDPKLIAAEMMSLPVEKIQARAALIQKIEENVEGICNSMNEKMEGGYSLNMSALQKELKRFDVFYAKFTDSFEEAASSEVAGNAEEVTAPSSVVAPVRATVKNNFSDLASFKATTRAEALLLLKKGAEYFRAEEPTSPVPYLIERALRLSEMNFMDLLADIAPDALSRGRDILGVRPDENNGESL